MTRTTLTRTVLRVFQVAAIAILALASLSAIPVHAESETVEGLEGWVFHDSAEDEADGVLERTGTALELQGDDDSTEVTLPFDFTFYGSEYSSLLVSTNGYICFDTDAACDDTEGYLDESYDGPVMAPLWTDLRTDGDPMEDYDLEQDIVLDVFTYYDSEEMLFTIQWIAVDYEMEFPVDFSVTLFNDGEEGGNDGFTFKYGQVQTNEGLDYEYDVSVGIANGEESEEDDEGFGPEEFGPGYINICEGDFDEDWVSLEGYGSYEYCSDPHYFDDVHFYHEDFEESGFSSSSYSYYTYEMNDNTYDHGWDTDNEPPIDGVAVNIYQDYNESGELEVGGEENDMLVAELTTDSDGYYSFDEIDSDYDYFVSVPQGDDFPDCLVGSSDTIKFVSYDDYYRKHAQQFFGFVDDTEDPSCTEDTSGEDDTSGEESSADGIEPAVENAGPNDGDANGDGTKDSMQDNVGSTVNPATGNYAVVEAPAGTTLSAVSFVNESTLTAQDPDTEYPVGLASFTVGCGSNGCSAPITITYDQQYDTSTWVFKKFQNGTFTDISSIVSYGTKTVGATTVTTATYTLVDGGPYDADGVANGTIVDPAGPSVLGLAATGTPASAIMGAGVALISSVAYVTVISRKRTIHIPVQFM